MSKQSEAMSALSDAEFEEFIRTLGNLVFRTTPAAAFGRHKNPLDTVRDYFDTSKDSTVQALAGQFWKDLVARYATTESISQKWFGMSASDLSAQVAQERDDS